MVLARDSWNGRGLEGELMNKKDEWITRAVHVLRKVEFGGTELDYWYSDDVLGDPWGTHVVE